MEALKAQAVAARSYALTLSTGQKLVKETGKGFHENYHIL
jgi:peptidoglycan hydrolase-like amidase